MTDEISAEVKEDYRMVVAMFGPKHIMFRLVRWAIHERAMRLKAEWQWAHRCRYVYVDGLAVAKECDDPRHDWTDTDWERFVEEELSK